MKYALILLAGVCASELALAKVNCSVSAPNPKEPNTYDQQLISFEMSEQGGYEFNQHALIAKDRLSARAMSSDEFKQRDANKDYKDIDGQLVVNFQHPESDDFYGIVITTVDAAAQTSDKMDQKIAIYGTVTASGLVTFDIARKLAIGCLPEKASIKP